MDDSIDSFLLKSDLLNDDALWNTKTEEDSFSSNFLQTELSKDINSYEENYSPSLSVNESENLMSGGFLSGYGENQITPEIENFTFDLLIDFIEKHPEKVSNINVNYSENVPEKHNLTNNQVNILKSDVKINTIIHECNPPVDQLMQCDKVNFSPVASCSYANFTPFNDHSLQPLTKRGRPKKDIDKAFDEVILAKITSPPDDSTVDNKSRNFNSLKYRRNKSKSERELQLELKYLEDTHKQLNEKYQRGAARIAFYMDELFKLYSKK